MKFLKYISILSIVVGFSSCGDPELPYEPFDDMQYGAFARLLSVSGEFNYFDVAGSSYTWTVEFYDENKGQNVTAFDWTVEYIDNANGGANSVGPVSIASFSTGDFSTNGDGLPGMTGTFTFQQALDALGLTINDINGGDAFRFLSTVTKADGSTFSRANTGPNVISSAPFSGFFTLDANVICPSSLEGTFDVVSTNMSIAGGFACGAGGGAAADPFNTTVTWTNEGSGAYTTTDLSFGVFENCWADAPANSSGARIIDACGIITTSGADQYGDTYDYDITSIAGPVMTIDWINSYGDAGTAQLTRQDGADWPALTTN